MEIVDFRQRTNIGTAVYEIPQYDQFETIHDGIEDILKNTTIFEHWEGREAEGLKEMYKGRDVTSYAYFYLTNANKEVRSNHKEHRRHSFYSTCKRVFYCEGLYAENYKNKRLFPHLTHISKNCKLRQPIEKMQEICAKNFKDCTKILPAYSKDYSKEICQKGELLMLFEYYLRETLNKIVTSLDTFTKFYLWYRDCVFFLDMTGSYHDFETFDDYKEYLKPKLEDEHTNKFYKDILKYLRDQVKDKHPVFDCNTKDQQARIRRYLDEKLETDENLTRFDSVFYCVLICIGRTIDIFAISVTNNIENSDKLLQIWKEDAELEMLDPLHETVKVPDSDTSNKMLKEAQRYRNEGNDVIKKDPATAFKKYFQSMNKSIEGGAYDWKPSSNAMNALRDVIFKDESEQSLTAIYQNCCLASLLAFEATTFNPLKLKCYYNASKLDICLQTALVKTKIYDDRGEIQSTSGLGNKQMTNKQICILELGAWINQTRNDFAWKAFKSKNDQRDTDQG
jgi:hypothetical protein